MDRSMALDGYCRGRKGGAMDELGGNWNRALEDEDNHKGKKQSTWGASILTHVAVEEAKASRRSPQEQVPMPMAPA